MLGDVHEHKVLATFVAEFGTWDPATGAGVYDVVPAESMDRATLLAKHHESIEALRSGADVVFQAAFFDGQFHGRSDFLVRRPDGSYAVFDTKLARHAKVTALLQLAAYGDQLLKAGIRPDPAVTLVLGATVPVPGGGFDYVRSHHRLAEILPVFRERRDRFLALTSGAPGSARDGALGRSGITACGRCDYCQEQVQATDDLLLVARMNSRSARSSSSRAFSPSRNWRKPAFGRGERLTAAAAGPGPDAERTRRRGRRRRGIARTAKNTRIRYRVIPENTLAELPPPSRGRHLLRLRGRSAVAGKRHRRLGAGVPVRRDRSTDRAPAAPACTSSSGPTAGRRRSRPSWTSWTMSRSAGPGIRTCTSTTTPPTRKLPSGSSPCMHVAGEDTVDQWLRDGAPGGPLPDRPEQHPDLRELLQHQETRTALHGDEPALRGRERRRRLRGGLRPVLRGARRRPGRGGRRRSSPASRTTTNTTASPRWSSGTGCWAWRRSAGSGPAAPGVRRPRRCAASRRPTTRLPPDDGGEADAVLSSAELALAGLPDPAPVCPRRTGRRSQCWRRLSAITAASARPFWWAHFDRCENGPDTHQHDRNVFLVEDAEVLEDWWKDGGKLPERRVRLTGTVSARLRPPARAAPGSACTSRPLPAGLRGHRHRRHRPQRLVRDRNPGTRARRREGHRRHPGQAAPQDTEPYAQLPIALTEDQPLQTRSLEEALAVLADDVTAACAPAGPGFRATRPWTCSGAFRRGFRPGSPCRPPARARTVSLMPSPRPSAALDHSYLAVQGPPGTGKTYVGSHVIARLVARGWKIGVVGQSHAVVENLLKTAIGKAGVDPARVAKESKHPEPPLETAFREGRRASARLARWRAGGRHRLDHDRATCPPARWTCW